MFCKWRGGEGVHFASKALNHTELHIIQDTSHAEFLYVVVLNIHSALVFCAQCAKKEAGAGLLAVYPPNSSWRRVAYKALYNRDNLLRFLII